MKNYVSLNPQPEPPGISTLLAKLGGIKSVMLGGLTVVVLGGVGIVATHHPSVALKTTSIAISITPKLGTGSFDVTVPYAAVKTNTFTVSYGGALTNLKASGQQTSGAKASGTLLLSNSCRTPVTIDNSSLITWSEAGKTYLLNQSASVTIMGGSYGSVPIVATAIGSDYNAPDGQMWQFGSCIKNYGSTSGAITGGFSLTDTIVSQNDADYGTKEEGLKLFKVNQAAAEAAATAAGNIVIPGHDSYAITKTTTKPAVGSIAQTFVSGAEETISVLVTTPADLLAAITSVEPTKNHANWKATTVTIHTGQAGGDTIVITGTGDNLPVIVNVDKLKAKFIHDGIICSQIAPVLKADPFIASFTIKADPVCSMTTTPTATLSLTVQKQ